MFRPFPPKLLLMLFFLYFLCINLYSYLFTYCVSLLEHFLTFSSKVVIHVCLFEFLCIDLYSYLLPSCVSLLENVLTFSSKVQRCDCLRRVTQVHRTESLLSKLDTESLPQRILSLIQLPRATHSRPFPLSFPLRPP